MQVKISEIIIDPGRRAALPEDIQRMADSIAEVGLLSPITIDARHTLIAGLHRLEAAKLLGWVEIECNVADLNGLQAELAEIDENFVRKDLSGIEYSDLLLRRKEIYESLHPETKQGMRNGRTVKNDKMSFLEAKPFTEDAAEKRGVSRRTIERDVQMAKNLSPAAKEIIKKSGARITKKGAMALSRLNENQQKEAAEQIASGEICSIDEYMATQSEAEQTEAEQDAPPFHIEVRQFDTFAEGVADLKNTEKDCSCNPSDFLNEVTAFAIKFQREIQWYSNPYYETVFPLLTTEQLKYLRQQTDSICDAANQLYKNIMKGRN